MVSAQDPGAGGPRRGMIWSQPGGAGMLQLRASVKSERFQSDYERLLSTAAPMEDQPMAARPLSAFWKCAPPPPPPAPC